MSSLPIINPEDSIPVVADNRRENKDTRLRWIPFTKTSVVRGEEVVSFPFLENENWKDLLLVRLLLVERPYKAGYGATIKAWDDIALQLRNEKHPETGELLFGHKGIKGKAIKERFLACMEFVKQQDREALRRTGTDDEAEPGEILNALEDLYSDWQSHCALGDTKNNSVAAQKKKIKMLQKPCGRLRLVISLLLIMAATTLVTLRLTGYYRRHPLVDVYLMLLEPPPRQQQVLGQDLLCSLLGNTLKPFRISLQDLKSEKKNEPGQSVPKLNKKKIKRTVRIVAFH
jgi:hypothetical protein